MSTATEVVDVATLVLRGIELISEIVREIDAAKEGLKSPADALQALEQMRATLATKRAERDERLKKFEP